MFAQVIRTVLNNLEQGLKISRININLEWAKTQIALIGIEISHTVDLNVDLLDGLAKKCSLRNTCFKYLTVNFSFGRD